MTLQSRLETVLQNADLPPDSVVLAGPPEPGTPPPPEGPWLMLPFGEQYVVGGMSRGAFRAYETLWSFEDALRLAVRLCRTSGVQRPVDDGEGDLQPRGEATADGIRSRAAGRGGRPGTAEVSAGAVLDLVGPETAHHLFALGTPFPQRSQPPTDVGREYHRYEVLQPPVEAEEGVAAPWFGQPGGGAMVVLGRPVRWYLDQGYLVELVSSEDPVRRG
jgi:hypothetical protein